MSETDDAAVTIVTFKKLILTWCFILYNGKMKSTNNWLIGKILNLHSLTILHFPTNECKLVRKCRLLRCKCFVKSALGWAASKMAVWYGYRGRPRATSSEEL